jgi:hypothetical protein
MKRLPTICAVLLLIALLCGCRAQVPSEDRVLVIIEETQGCTVENNGLLVSPGDDASFTLTLDQGYSLAATDYPGQYHHEISKDNVTLTFESIDYPTRVHLRLTSKYCTITYDANGGFPLHSEEKTISKNYDLSYHRRPNTDQGTNTFSRKGYTLLCWNTRQDGSGERIGLGSRVTAVGNSLVLYAQWVKWSDAKLFTYAIDETVLYDDEETLTITGYCGTEKVVVIPQQLDGKNVTAIASGAFSGCNLESVVLPSTIRTVHPAAFENCSLRSATIFDNIEKIQDASFSNCPAFQTLYINAIEVPFGYSYRKESSYADKADALILAQGKKKLVFYGGCSTWYNLDGTQVSRIFGDAYAIINMGLNGIVNSDVQMQVMGAFLQQGDVLLHTPELSSKKQLMISSHLDKEDDKLWCGLENNYDLFTLVDLRTVSGVFDSFCAYLSLKSKPSDYMQFFKDEYDRPYLDAFGCIPFSRTQTADVLPDNVFLDPSYIDDQGMMRLLEYYSRYQSQGVQVYLSYACVNIDAVPQTQQENVALMDSLFRNAMGDLGGPPVISRLEDFIYHRADFFDTNYHLLSEPAKANTAIWLRDLLVQMKVDGLWKEDA